MLLSPKNRAPPRRCQGWDLVAITGASLPAFVLSQGRDATVLSSGKTLLPPLRPALQGFQASVPQIQQCRWRSVLSGGCP